MATKLRSLCCNQLLWRGVLPCMTRRIQASSSWREEQKTFFEKNDKLKRPMSPHLTIYSFPLPPLLSGSHRATGLAMFTGIAAFGIGVNLLPGDYTQSVEVIKALPYASALLFLTKLYITWPLCYHGMNGVRHMVWDTARGLDMKTLYTTGYAVVALSILTALGISLL
ncbi:succinate dehydrogenase cytochrome b560 subunit, mitochondrial-like [Asterias amurensis]|uniref:succinate dehydrogenase cytochrome b560 subunit, mitochondrial-like n=1 Tax=Asterias amurensis TaxID=7602 RepID=UPI003AB8AE91